MAITSYNGLSNKPSESLNTASSIKSNGPPYRFVKIHVSTDASSCSTTKKSKKFKKYTSISPYLANNVQTTSRINEKRSSIKAPMYPSSFPLAMNIYKANSDELNSLRRANKKVRKSVLTLPNDPAPLPQACTVSDMNDSEYFDHKNDKHMVKPKKRPLQNKKHRGRSKNYEFYDRDARYCSQLNIDLDRSSTDIINYNGDSKRNSYDKQSFKKLKEENSSLEAHDVWAVLRNINRFQFQPSPPLSQESIVMPKKKKSAKRRINRKDARVIETCRTEEFAYISSYEIDRKSHNTFSPSSSIDRITVIDKQDELSQICGELGSILNTNEFIQEPAKIKRRKQTNNEIQKTKLETNYIKSNGPTKMKINPQLMPPKKANRKSIKQIAYKNEEIQKISVDQNCATSDDTSDTSKGYDNSMREERNNVDCSTSYSSLSGSVKAECGKRNWKVSSPRYKGISKVIVSKGRESVQEEKTHFVRNQPGKHSLSTSMSNAGIATLKTENNKNLTCMKSLAHTDIITENSKANEATTNTEVGFIGIFGDIISISGPNTNKSCTYFNKSRTTKQLTLNNRRNNNTESFNKAEKKKIDEIKNIHSSEVESGKIDKSLPKFKDKMLSTDPLTNTEMIDNKLTLLKHVATEEVMKAHQDSEITLKDYTNCKGMEHFNPKSATYKNIAGNKPPTSVQEIRNVLEQSKHKKPLTLLKDRMLNFLHRQSSSNVNKNPHKPTYISRTSGEKIDTKFEIQGKRIPEISNNLRSVKSTMPSNTSRNVSKQRWAKAKWASDFIENVIRKITKGVYYTQDARNSSVNSANVVKEISIQTVGPKSDLSLTSDLQVQNEDALRIISDNDNVLSAVEIRTLNSNQIAIKHCVTNVILEFDVTIPAETKQVIMNAKTSSTLIPLDVTESQTKVFKSKTTIVNAVLPAELCAIMPKMMRSLFDSHGKPTLPLLNYPLGVLKTDTHLSTISEIARCESTNPFKCLTVSLYLSPEVKNLLKGGVFPKDLEKHLKRPTTIKVFKIVDYNSNVILGLLPKVCTNVLPKIAEINRGMTLGSKDSQARCTSKALVPYSAIKKSTARIFSPYNFTSFVQNVMKNKCFEKLLRPVACIDEMKVLYDGRNVTVNMSFNHFQGDIQNMTLWVNNLQIESLFQSKIYNLGGCINQEQTKIKNTELKYINGVDRAVKTIESRGQFNTATNKYRKKGFFKLYKKCKSTTNIPVVDKSTNMPLGKINTLDDFLQILGSKKWLSNIFDGNVARKILTSIIEMKNWIAEINPRQALLVLLLINKKDTPNLVRFRPILLQGIAVNRITRVTELDMEIEVIETENFHKFSQYEAIPSAENNDNLLEELYWIAKTTASDYQRPFDETSEKLLNSLLEKRKKLNPSYLRVMARYVGLGLLKAPLKK